MASTKRTNPNVRLFLMIVILSLGIVFLSINIDNKLDKYDAIIPCGITNLVTWINILLCAWNCWIDLMFLIEQANIKDMIACIKLGGKFILLLNLFFVISINLR